MSSTDIGRLHALAVEFAARRAHLAELQHAYAVMDRSKFARLRSVAALLGSLAGRKTARIAAYSAERGEMPLTAARPGGPLLLNEHELWLLTHAAQADQLALQRSLSAMLPYRPTISIIMPAYESPRTFLIEAIESVMAQSYPHWQLCVADDNSPSPHVREVLERFAARDPRITVVFRETNGHISEASNSAIAVATGEFIGLLDHDDVLAPDALFEVAHALTVDPSIDMLYSDEDKIDDHGRRVAPYFKPDWSPESFLSKMYTSHFGVYRRALVTEIGGFRPAYDGSQDYDLVLRFTERTDRIHHIPRVLYSWRMHAESAAGSTEAKPYAYIAARKAIAEAMERRGEPGRVDPVPNCTGLYVPRFIIRKPGRVAIVIPSRDNGAVLERCLKSIFLKSTYADFEVIVVDNGTKEAEAKNVLRRWKGWDAQRFSVVERDEPFNFSRLVNAGAAATGAPYLVLLNNDTEVITHDWLELMIEQAQREPIGAVGVKLLFGDGRLQHSGIALGLGGAAGHVNYTLERYDLNYFGAAVTLANYSAVTAACMMIRRSVFDAVSGFDETFSVAYNDVDFCLRLRGRGYRNVYLPHVELYHHESASRGSDLDRSPSRRNLLEQEMLIDRWSIREQPDPYYNVNLALTDPWFKPALAPEDRMVFRAPTLLRQRSDDLALR
ncbi:MAG: glycosyltransferase family 2 protein [Candidatus Eremiobacteraeota bacterium]|nr:glycosyltransferase family 2 protein [Candidatus Eremiobacteraeota bacterium]